MVDRFCVKNPSAVPILLRLETKGQILYLLMLANLKLYQISLSKPLPSASDGFTCSVARNPPYWKCAKIRNWVREFGPMLFLGFPRRGAPFKSSQKVGLRWAPGL